MTMTLCALLGWLLVRSQTAMAAARAACSLFVSSVLPGLFPYMVPALMLTSRLPDNAPPFVVMLMGWCGGSPTGARLLAMRSELDASVQRRLAVTCATMSPMFLLGTVPQWLDAPETGAVLLAAALLGGWLTGLLAGKVGQTGGQPVEKQQRASPLSFAEAVMQAARTMLLVCGTMMLGRVAAALAGELLADCPGISLAVTTLLEVTSGAALLSGAQMSLAMRTALIAAATGFGGAAILLQNRAAYPDGLLTLGAQLAWQALHAVLSGGLAYAGMLLLCR